jgi:hypothetical protein
MISFARVNLYLFNKVLVPLYHCCGSGSDRHHFGPFWWIRIGIHFNQMYSQIIIFPENFKYFPEQWKLWHQWCWRDR